MIKVLFICYGNICRSPMAEFLMKEEISKQSLSDEFQISSAATSDEEIGHGVYREVRKILQAKGIDCSNKVARKLVKEDYSRFDYILTMDSMNYSDAVSLFGGKNLEKVMKLGDFCQKPKDIADPWWTRDFVTTYNEISEGIVGFINFLKNSGKIRSEK